MRKIILSMLLALIGLIFNSCQKDDVSNDNGKLTNQSVLADLLMRVSHSSAANMSTRDEDESVCFTVSLPITFSMNGQLITVADQTNYSAFLIALHNMYDEDISVIFDFPITISYEDGTTLVLNSIMDLHAALRSCHSDDDDDDDIECLVIHYPLQISFYDSVGVENVLVFNDDGELFAFLDNLEDDDAFVINFPVTITDSNGSMVVVSNNGQLEAIIEVADDECGDHDGDHDEDR
ncbi:hypothetical protein NAT51_13340 [Flavobacterium amniphilum]|uniref:hypothetical protein n=1 Tax=Flavobacterium amniphilum TaxID=1834035 RepID=UPI002029E3D4|nr:hypothetical protein [Flavobacterium amniphilum]MCL9806515.1 hypothetical protein [Flavobacterium amniphilum]